MKIFATNGYLTIWGFFDVIKNHRSARLTPGSEHLLKTITYVFDIIHEQGNCFDVRDDTLEKINYYSQVSNKYLVFCGLILESIVIADNKPMDFCYSCYK